MMSTARLLRSANGTRPLDDPSGHAILTIDMTTLVPGRHHPALDLEPSLRVEYADIVGALVGADRKVDESELRILRELCETLELSESNISGVMGHATQSDAPEPPHLKRFAEPDVCHALIIDVVDIIYADGIIDSAELNQVDRLARSIGVPAGQVGMILRYIQARRSA